MGLVHVAGGASQWHFGYHLRSYSQHRDPEIPPDPRHDRLSAVRGNRTDAAATEQVLQQVLSGPS